MLVTLPILLPLLSAAMCLIAWGRVRVQNIIMVACTAGMAINGVILLAHVLQNGPVVANLSGWDAPFGIIMAGDVLSAIMTVITGVIGLAIAVYSIGGTTEARAANGHAPLVLTMIAAVAGAFVAGDIFNLYVWFELMLLSSFVLLTLGGERAQLEGAIKYVTLNLLSSMIFLAGIGLLYASTGSLNMADLAGRLDAMDNPTKATALAAPLLIAFGIKAAVFPLFFWLPASYHTPPPVVSALFAGLLTKVGVYSLIRVTTLIFDQEQAIIADSIIVVAGLTMLSGVLGAVSQDDFRRILSFHIVSQIGYMLMGLGIALSVDARGGSDADVAALAMGGAVFYIVHHIIVKTNLFLIAGVVVAERGTSELKRLGGLVTTHPVLSGLFLFSSLSLAGIPILS
ncbi:MAG: proton-conducting transporter membrane subunit, partial [Planctomycetota bacterium]